MKSASGVRLAKNFLTKRTATTTSSAKATAQPLRYYEAATTACPHAATTIEETTQEATSISSSAIIRPAIEKVRPYSEVPGPTPLPILGNTWR